MRIDGHQHFWSLRREDYGWLTSELQPLYRDFMLEHLQPLLVQAGVDHTVLVQNPISRPVNGSLGQTVWRELQVNRTLAARFLD